MHMMIHMMQPTLIYLNKEKCIIHLFNASYDPQLGHTHPNKCAKIKSSDHCTSAVVKMDYFVPVNDVLYLIIEK